MDEFHTFCAVMDVRERIVLGRASFFSGKEDLRVGTVNIAECLVKSFVDSGSGAAAIFVNILKS
ncbi:MAG: hypothetical protein Q4D81_08080 [Eubacteriales bacterium]|nr:hypothetical protein [Eubacteriales bacterium]